MREQRSRAIQTMASEVSTAPPIAIHPLKELECPLPDWAIINVSAPGPASSGMARGKMETSCCIRLAASSEAECRICPDIDS